MKKLIAKVAGWAASKGGWSHTLVVVWLGGVGLYASVPAVKSFADDVWVLIPNGLLHAFLVAVAGAAAFYANAQKAKPDA